MLGCVCVCCRIGVLAVILRMSLIYYLLNVDSGRYADALNIYTQYHAGQVGDKY